MLLKRTFVNVFSLVGGIAFVDTAYLASEHYFGKTVVCAFFNGCDRVLSSSYSAVFGIPISYIGAIYYAVLLGLILMYAFNGNENILKLILGLTGIGFLTSFFLVYVQVFIIRALCLYCLISAISSTVLFLIALLAFIKVRFDKVLKKVDSEPVKK